MNRNGRMDGIRRGGRSRGWRVWRASLLAGGLAGGIVLAGCHRQRQPAPEQVLPTVEVRTAAVRETNQMVTEEVVGTVRAKLRAVIEAKVSGRIEQMLVAPGQSVQSGQTLVRLDEREIRARLEQAKALLAQSKSDLERFSALLKEEAVTQSEFDAVQARERVARASVSEAEATLSQTVIAAPFAGVISRKLADVGDLAGPGRALLEIEDPTTFRLEADVPESLIGGLELGQTNLVRLAASQRGLEGVVSEIAPAADPNSRTFPVKFDLPPTPGLRAGLFGRVAVPVRESRFLLVPETAVVQRGQLEMAFVVAEQRVQLRLIKTGRRQGGYWEVLSGLAGGEPVVVSGASTLTDGQPVKLLP